MHIHTLYFAGMGIVRENAHFCGSETGEKEIGGGYKENRKQLFQFRTKYPQNIQSAFTRLIA